MKVKTYLEKNPRPVTLCGPDDVVQDVAQALGGQNACALPVCNADGEMVGIVSERDVVRALGDKGRASVDLTAKDLMSTPVVSCSPDQSMAHVRETMHRRGFRNMPVLEGGAVVGVIGVRDALNMRLDQNQTEINVLRDTVIATRR